MEKGEELLGNLPTAIPGYKRGGERGIGHRPFSQTKRNLTMIRTVTVLLLALPCILAVGGMAELKSITGDAPYEGPGNAPAVMPQPMGFWGRPRYYSGMPSQYGPGGWYNGDGGRFSSVSGGPYALRTGYIPTDTLYGSNRRFSPLDNQQFNTDSVLGSLLGTADNSPSSMSMPEPRPVARSSPIVSSFGGSPSSSLSAATGGGFYKGRGNN